MFHNSHKPLLRATALTILIFKQRLTPALGIGVNLYLRISMVDAIGPKAKFF